MSISSLIINQIHKSDMSEKALLSFSTGLKLD